MELDCKSYGMVNMVWIGL